MKRNTLSEQLAKLSIRNSIIGTCAVYLVLIIGSNLYGYLSNEPIIAQQKNLTGSRLRKTLIFETIGKHVALAELESRSFILFEKEEFRTLRKNVWATQLTPAIAELETIKHSFVIGDHQTRVTQLIDNLTAYAKGQDETETAAQALFTQTATMDTAAAKLAKDALAAMVNEKQHHVFDAIKEGAAYLSDEQRRLMAEESQTVIADLRAQQRMLIVIIIASFLLAVLMSYWVIRSITQPLNQLSTYMHEVSQGRLPDTMAVTSNEIGAMTGTINGLVAHLRASATFALRVGEGNYYNEFTPASADDTLGNSLLTMQEKLRQIEIEDKKRNWATEGFAQFSELLRTDNADVKTLADTLIAGLVKYLHANQGGLFVLNDTDTLNPCIELTACYAFNRKKFLEKRIEMGEGLIGQAMQEAATIYITDVPNEYVRITSGLGDAAPRSILIVPLKVNENVYGAIELASFNAFAAHEIEFVEKLSESIASSISSVKVNQETKRLLETAQQQAEEMKAAEEEMRQNMEELQATQEAQQRLERELREKEEQMQRKLLEAQRTNEELQATLR